MLCSASSIILFTFLTGANAKELVAYSNQLVNRALKASRLHGTNLDDAAFRKEGLRALGQRGLEAYKEKLHARHCYCQVSSFQGSLMNNLEVAPRISEEEEEVRGFLRMGISQEEEEEEEANPRIWPVSTPAPALTPSVGKAIDSRDPKAESCAICLEMFRDDADELLCGHWLHTECKVELEERGIEQCPLCRVPFPKEEKKQDQGDIHEVLAVQPGSWRQALIIQALINVLHGVDREAQQEAAGQLAKLALHNKNRDLIYEEGGVEPLQNLLHKGTQTARILAAAALQMLGEPLRPAPLHSS